MKLWNASKALYIPKKNLYRKLNIILTSLSLKKKIKNYKFDKSMFIHPFINSYNNISLNHFSLRQRIFKLIFFLQILPMAFYFNIKLSFYVKTVYGL